MVDLKNLLFLSVLALTCPLLFAHPLDFHYRGPEDDQLEKEIEQKKAAEEYNDVYSNPDSSEQERDAATERLDKAGMLA